MIVPWIGRASDAQVGHALALVIVVSKNPDIDKMTRSYALVSNHGLRWSNAIGPCLNKKNQFENKLKIDFNVSLEIVSEFGIFVENKKPTELIFEKLE